MCELLLRSLEGPEALSLYCSMPGVWREGQSWIVSNTAGGRRSKNYFKSRDAAEQHAANTGRSAVPPEFALHALGAAVAALSCPALGATGQQFCSQLATRYLAQRTNRISYRKILQNLLADSNVVVQSHVAPTVCAMLHSLASELVLSKMRRWMWPAHGLGGNAGRCWGRTLP